MRKIGTTYVRESYAMFLRQTKYVEPKAATTTPTFLQPIALADQELLILTGLSEAVTSQKETNINGIYRGKDFPWIRNQW